MDWSDYLLVPAIAIGSLVYGFMALRRARLMTDTPTSKIRSASQGYVELAGEADVLPEEPVASPPTSTPCVWFAYRVEKRSLLKNREWETVEEETSARRFLLRDATGECIVDPYGAEVLHMTEQVWRGREPDWSGPAPEKSPFFSFLYDDRCTEKRIEPGDPLYALGDFRTETTTSESSGDPRKEIRAVIERWKREQPGLFDTNGDGRVERDEFEAIRKAAVREVAKARALGRQIRTTNILCRSAHQPFVLSSMREQALIKKYRKRAGGSLFGFIIFAVGSVVLWPD